MQLNIKNYISVIVLICIAAALGCSSGLPIVFEHSLNKYDYVVASADNGYTLTMPQLYDILSGTNYLRSGGILEAEKVRELIDSILIDTLIGFRADTVDLTKNYEYYYRFREGNFQRLVKSYYTEAIFTQVSVDSAEVTQFIEEHPELFTVKEQILVSHIVVIPRVLRNGPDSMLYKDMTPEEIEESARRIAFSLRDSIDSKETFEEIAKKYSHDEATAKYGGIVGWATRNMYQWPFDSVAFSAKPGDIVGPYRDKDGWQLLYISDYVPEGVPPIDRNQIITALQAIQMEKSRGIIEKVLDTLLADMEIIYNEEVLDTNAYFVAKPTWAAIVNDIDTIDFGEIIPAEETMRNKYKVSNSTVAMKKELIDYLAQRRVIAQEARRMGLDTLPDYVAASNDMRHRMARLILESQMGDPGWEPSQETMEQYYDEHIEEFTVSKPVQVQQIVVPEISLAEFIRDQANAGVSFMNLAREYYPGDESVTTELFNLGWIGPEEVSKEFFDAAMITRVGEVTDPVKSEFGYHIIKVLDKKLSVPFEKARTEIRSKLKEEKIQKEIREFKEGLRKEFNAIVSDRMFPIHLKPYDQRQNKL